MGACTGKSKNQGEKLQSVKVGGSEHGLVKWIVLRGANIANPETQTGWEMKFMVDSKQNVSGTFCPIT
jgi:hypothetical protein